MFSEYGMSNRMGPWGCGLEVAVLLETNVSRGLRSSRGFGWRNDNSGVMLVEEVPHC